MAGSSGYNFSADTKMLSSQFNLNFEWFRGHYLPITQSGTWINTTGSMDLGSAAFKWRDIYNSGSISTKDITLSGSISAKDITLSGSISTKDITLTGAVAASSGSMKLIYIGTNVLSGSTTVAVTSTNINIRAGTIGHAFYILTGKGSTAAIKLYDNPASGAMNTIGLIRTFNSASNDLMVLYASPFAETFSYRIYVLNE